MHGTCSAVLNTCVQLSSALSSGVPRGGWGVHIGPPPPPARGVLNRGGGGCGGGGVVVCFIFTAWGGLGLGRGPWGRAGGWGGAKSPPPPEIPQFYKVEPDCKLSGKCLVFVFQHRN
jgi:hypothetical protein